MNAMSTANPRTFLSTTSVTVAILVFTSLVNGVVTQTPGVRPITDPRPKSYFHILNNAVGKAKNSHLLQNSSFASTLRNSMLDFHRLGYEDVVANFFDGIYPAEDKRQSIGKSQNSVYKDTLLTLTDSLRNSTNDGNNNVSSTCLGDLARILIGIVDLEKWVIPFVDSTGKPGRSLTELRLKFVGNYKQCRSSKAPAMPEMESKGFEGNYCVLNAAIIIKEIPMLKAQIGVCVPSTCSAEDLTMIASEALQSVTNMSSSLQPLPADCHTDEREITTATVMAILLLSLIGFMMLVGTAYDLLAIQRLKWTDQLLTKEPSVVLPKDEGQDNHVNVENGAVGMGMDTQPLTPTSVVKGTSAATGSYTKFLLAFSVYTNATKGLDTTQPSGSLGAIHGIRFLSMSWVVLGHTYAYGFVDIENILDFQLLSHHWTFAVIGNAIISVDTFFTLSGLLTSYLTIKHMMSKSWKINWAMFYFHRFWRLTPPYMLVLLLVLGLQRFLGSGAMWDTTQPFDKQFCEDNWWTNLLYINNLVNNDKLCFRHSWYLANDMQFFLVSPLMLIPFYFHYSAGIASCLAFLLVTWTTAGVLSFQNSWSPVAGRNLASGTYAYDYYIAPWCRIGPYVVGILAGYVLAITEGGKQLRMRWWMVVLGWTLATASGLAVVYGIEGDVSGDHPSSVGAAAFYNAVSRSVWGACVCWVIVACASGYGGPVNTLLSWSPFVFLSKLTYMSYLIHPCLLYVFFQNMESEFYIDDTNVAIVYLGMLVSVNMTAFVLMLALESPWIGLEKYFIRKDGKN